MWAEGTGNPMPTLTFHGTVKLHGSNGGLVAHRDGGGKMAFHAQSRSCRVEVGNDNYGMAALIESMDQQELIQLFNLAIHYLQIDSSESLITIFGERVGRGIQKGTALNQFDGKQFVIFQVAVGEGEDAKYVGNNANISMHKHNIFNIAEIPSYTISVDFDKPEDAMKEMERLTMQVEEECPWGKKFGKEGIGEGIVWTCVERPADSDLWFKTKGPKHAASKTKTVAIIDPEKVKSIRECVDKLVTEYRMDQALDYIKQQGMDVEMKSMGPFLRYFFEDLQREEADTVEASGIDWKPFQRAASNTLRVYFINKTKEF